MTKDEILYGVALKRVPSIGDQLAKNLISYCGSTEAVFKEKKSKLVKIPGLGKKNVESILQFKGFDEVNQELEWGEEKGVKTIFYMDKEYPYRLKDCMDSPLFLFVKGEADLNNKKIISVVGTRNATNYGKEFCYSLAKALSNTGCLVLSGLAFGIDAHAHKEALNNQLPTAAVLGHGLKTISPPRNRFLAKEIIDANGALITEHFSYEAPVPENFPKRNRIVAGMCDGLVIVESGARGGSMITAELAWGYNRELFALPGKISDTYSLGCNKLISSNRAMCIESADKLVEYLGWKIQNTKTPVKMVVPIDLSELEKKVYNSMRAGEKRIDDLHFESGIPLTNLSLILLDLEFKGLVLSLPGKTYKLRI